MTPEIKNKYDEYLVAHIANVKQAYDWLTTYLPEVIPAYLSERLPETIAIHDRSKYSDEEYFPYAEYFYGNRTRAVEATFNYAWLHHIHENPHHWQHWILVHDDEPVECLDMPYEYIIEMICDWWSFSFKTGNLFEIFNWYEQHKDMQLSEATRITVNNILDKIRAKLTQKEEN